jgi:uncharacterized membrane protein
MVPPVASYGSFLGIPGPEWHAALNDFPMVLVLSSVVFDLWGTAKNRESLSWAGYWCVIAGAAMGILAAVSGLLIEEGIEQTAEVSRLIEIHETLGLSLTGLFIGLAGWRIWRKNVFSAVERQSYTMASVVGTLALIWQSHLGGTMVYRHAAGIPSGVLQTELRVRADTALQAQER